MRYAVSIILLFISLAAFGQLDQFRMVGTGSWATQDDSTHYATVTFASDLTANSFLPTGIVDSMRVFTQRGQVYTIDSVGAKTFSTAVIYVVEYGGDWGKPSGQVVVYETRGRETVPAIPFASNGATSKLQEAVVTHNAGINNGISTATLADSTAAAKTYTNNQVAAVAPVKDTIVQASHGFSLGDPIWYSGDYLLALDTGTTVRVDGIISEVPDANTFVLQRTGRFTLTAHGFTVGVQLYVQPDGSYSATDTSNTLVYGYALDANTIEIGVKPDAVRTVANRYNDSLAGRGVTTKQEFLDSLAGFQSFADITSIQSASPSIGATIQDRRTLLNYKIQADSVEYFTVDDSLVINLGGKYAVADIGDKKEFASIEELKYQAPLLKIKKDRKVMVGGRELELTFSPEITTKGTWDFADTIVDGLFLDTVNVAFQGENIFRSSEYFYNNFPIGGKNIITFSGTYINNFGKGPDERGNAVGIVGNQTIFAFINTDDFTPNVEYVFSIYVDNHDVSTQYQVRASTGTNVSTSVDTSYKDWKRYSVVLPALATAPNFVTITFPSLGSSDTIRVANWQYEPNYYNDEPTSYKRTQLDISAKSGKMYINRGKSLIDGGYLRLDKMDRYLYPSSRRTNSDWSLLNSAIQYANGGKRFNTVKLGKGSYVIRQKLAMQDYVFLEGATVMKNSLGNFDPALKGTEIRISIQDSTSSGIEFAPIGGNQVITSTGLRDIGITVVDTLNKVIDITECNGCRFERVLMQPETNAKYKYGIDINTIGSSDSYWNDFIDIHIDNPDSIGVEYSGSTDNIFTRLEILGGNKGLNIKGGNSFIVNGAMLQACTTAVNIEGGNAYISNLYTEGSGIFPGAIIKADGSGSIHINNSTLQTDDGSVDTLFSISGLNRFDVSNSSIRTGGKTRITGDVGAINFHSVESTTPLSGLVISEKARQRLTVTDNTQYLGNTVYPNKLAGFLSTYSTFEESSIRNNRLTDSLYVNNIILSANGQNLVHHSDSISPAQTISFSAVNVVDVKPNNFTAPDGTNSATTFVYLTGDLNGAASLSVNVRSAQAIPIGETATVSLWVYNHKTTPIHTTTLRYRLNNDISNDVTLEGYLPSQEWTRLRGKFEIVATGSSSFSSRVTAPTGIAAGDSISYWGIQVERAETMGTYISTEGSAITLTNPTVKIPSGKSLTHDGNVTITGTLTAEKYRTFTPIIYDNVDTLLVDRLELGFESLKITDELDGLEVKQVTFTTDRNVTADTQVRLEYFDISASSYTSFGSGTILNGTNQITVTGLSQAVAATDIIYLEVVTTGGEANGISATLKLQ